MQWNFAGFALLSLAGGPVAANGMAAGAANTFAATASVATAEPTSPAEILNADPLIRVFPPAKVQNPISPDDPDFARLLANAKSQPTPLNWALVVRYLRENSTHYSNAKGGGASRDSVSAGALGYLLYKAGVLGSSERACGDFLTSDMVAGSSALYAPVLAACQQQGGLTPASDHYAYFTGEGKQEKAISTVEDKRTIADQEATAIRDGKYWLVSLLAFAELMHGNVAKAGEMAGLAQAQLPSIAASEDRFRDKALLHLAFVQFELGQKDRSNAALALVSPQRAPISRIWAAYMDTKP